MAISPKKHRIFITVDRNTVGRVREALDELGIGRGYLSRMLNDALTGQLVALQKLCELKRKKSKLGPTSFTNLLLDWGLEMGRLELKDKAKDALPGNGPRSRGHRGAKVR